ncbi:DNA internalization-related competence protein ComEC/Rec2 [Solibacillus sp. MA9]|uniref:DNA internalization-related competence protein ComEC/Rec2 n=1 Tax=Solibacillus palustris TaxID=2908203 RepID=A0ABS9UCV3_9BACL|nr:DNA internalization-related competence protein ComEC/Rec2 [Solibacillus sp. MA9]MCH7322175.1 DNA internalization-related competence protein ComEC/Rec2 [Solibacillus sp. MA9]
MLYLVNLWKHNWIYYALSVCISAVASFQSVRLLLILGLLVGFCLYKKLWKWHLVGIVTINLLTYSYFSYEVDKLQEPVTLPAELTWTDQYKINGVMLRGIMKDAQGNKVYVTYEIKSEQQKHELQFMQLAGQIYFVTGQQVEPSIPAHRYGFLMGRYLESKSARGIVEIGSMTLVGKKKTFLQPIYDQRFRLKEHIEQTFPNSLAAEAHALLIGLQENVDEELNRAYQKLGITHLFAISGLHVALVSLLFFQLLLRLGVRRELANILLLILLPIYAVLAGGAPSIWRAVSVVEFIMLAQYFRWKIPMDDAISLSLLVFLLIEPGAIYQVGFQLSYLATYSLVYSSRILARYENFWLQSFFITFVCQILVYPLLLHHFFEISLSSFIANIFFVPLFSFIILPVNLALLTCSFIPLPINHLIFTIYEPLRLWLTDLILAIQQPISQMWNPGKPSLFWLVVLYGSVLLAFYFLDKGSNLKKMAATLLIPAIIFHFQSYLHGELKIAFVNVGQGDCIVIELPYRKSVVVIDAGGLLRFEQEAWKERDKPYEVGRQVVVPYLKGRGIQKINTFILTHADADHVEGAEEVLREIRVSEVHVTPNSLDKEVMNDLLEELAKTKTTLIEKMASDGWQIGDVRFDYIWPHDTVYDGNNDSLVLLVRQGAFKTLFTGDLEKEGEEEIVRLYSAAIEQLDVLKTGHHGSKTSSIEAFVEQTSPKLAIFTAGENNRYKHPNIDVITRFEQRQIPYLITGYDGTIELRVKNGVMQLETSNDLFKN